VTPPRLKVLFVSPTVALYQGGTETVVRQLARSLEQRVDLTVLSGVTGDGSDLSHDGHVESRLITLPFDGRDTRINRLLNRIAGINPFKIESRSFFRSLRRSGTDLAAYDAIVSFYEMDAFLLARDQPSLAKRCTHLLPGVSLRRFFRHVGADSVVFLGYRAAARAERKWGVRIPSVPLGVDAAFFPSDPPAYPASRRLLFVGRLDRSKHVDWLADFFAQSGLAERGYTLEIVGDGPLGPTLQTRHRTTPGVRLHGRRNARDVIELLRGAHLVLHPTALESFGLTILEAMAAGVPVITHDLPSIRAWANDHPVYAARLDRAAWKQSITAFEDRQRWLDASATNLAFARGFTWDAVAERLLEIIERRTRAARAQP
jgi:glycosyltransferase involved in cell wall biosynthesis